MPDRRDRIIAAARIEYLATEEKLLTRQYNKRLDYLATERAKAQAVLDAPEPIATKELV